MYAYLKGRVIVAESEQIVIEVGGIGYAVNVSSSSLYSVGDEAEIYLHTAVREDDISLWGFQSRSQLQMFKLLLQVSGVGLKTAYALISELSSSQIVQAVMLGAPEQLKVKGVGGKTAERIILELKDKVAATSFGGEESSGSTPLAAQDMDKQDIISALTSLGYSAAQITAALQRTDLSSAATLAEKVKIILKVI